MAAPLPGGAVDIEGRHVEPTVIVDPDLDSPIMSEEIFGPILPVITVDSMDEAVALVNRRPKPLALYVFAEDRDAADAVLSATSSGGACVNHVVLHITPRPALRRRRRGWDRALPRPVGLRYLLQPEVGHAKPTKPDPSILYPPYTGLKGRLIRKFL